MRATFTCCLLLAAALSSPAAAAEALTGTYALPDGMPKVSATLTATPGADPKQVLDIAMTPLGASAPAAAYETELSKQLHVIAVSGDLRQFVHEHGEAPAANGHFSIPFTFPQQGLWHIYADGVPKGLGQQVMRFELTLGSAGPGSAPARLAPTGTTGVDGNYGVKFDGFGLKADQEAQLGLHLLRNGKAAPDVTPFLGVAAHAVFIDAADLTYVHVHAAPTEAPAAGGTGAGMQRDMTGMAPMPGMAAPPSTALAAPAAADPAMDGMAGMGAPMPDGANVPPDLTMHVKAPKAGTYLLWIQFNGGGQVRTVPFVVAVG